MFASQLNDMVMAGFAARLDPNAQITSKLVNSSLKEMENELIERTSETVQAISSKLAKAKESGDSPAVINALEKLLDRAVANA